MPSDSAPAGAGAGLRRPSDRPHGALNPPPAPICASAPKPSKNFKFRAENSAVSTSDVALQLGVIHEDRNGGGGSKDKKGRKKRGGGVGKSKNKNKKGGGDAGASPAVTPPADDVKFVVGGGKGRGRENR